MTDRDNGHFNEETGELPLPISERAVMASHPAVVQPIRLYAALMAAVAKMPVWITTDKPGAHKIKYATLKQILETVRPVLHANGIRIRQGADRSWPMDEGGGMKGRLIPVYTDLIHAESGEVDRTVIEIPLSRMDAQAMGSAITYGRRYTLIAALGLATDEADDDGESAKPRELTDGVKESSELAKLKQEIDACKDATSLMEWGEEVKSKKKADKLSQDEHTLLRKHYQTRQQKLLATDDEPQPEKPKKGKAE